MGKINILPDDLKNKIAAGEVVERPASVVKELIENSIDSGANAIEVIVRGGGNSSIQVIDNGGGLSKEDLVLAFSRHSTSKIGTVDDLFAIDTLGFRGEALASIASVARVKAQSLVNGGDSGYEISLADGKVTDPEPGPFSGGTAISVSDLFFSIPARRKFLKSAKTELRHIVRMVRRFALCRPDVSFTLIDDDREVMKLTPANLKDRIAAVFDPTYRENLLEVNHQAEPFVITGYVGNLNLVRKRRGQQNLFLNERYIVNRLLNSAVYSAYQSLVSRGEFPFFVLNLHMPFDSVDVNVHPMKTEVRFRDEWRIYHTLKIAVSTALEDVIASIPDFLVPSEGPIVGGSQETLTLSSPSSSDTVSRQSVERAKSYVKSLGASHEEETDVNLGNIWQIHTKYIISEIKSGLVVIDQHVAHERVLFEQAMDAMEGSTLPSQTLLFPEVVELPAEDFSTLLELIPYLYKIGFRMKEFGKQTVMIEGVPFDLGWGSEKEVLTEIIDTYRNQQEAQPSFMEAVAASYACKAAVKAGDPLTQEEMQSLIDRLFATKHPYYCPHGRPIMANLSLDELDRRFERS
ncbi:MAG: DNA mismatch repair protein MutL [Candidatus Marinimicrobia bacterium]|nr:DNA mismatch repair protein MutL [Candidatus Neomarinimicrobiota bacterium]|tara:strand:+ start:205 stop:1932 length:1728 start_codon:yes stop_codon:yes gene_type:complete